MSNIITADYYDTITGDMLLKRITPEDMQYITEYITEPQEEFLFKRWNTIVCGLSHNYYEQYSLQNTAQDRNAWFQRYLQYPTKDMSLMPEIL